MAGSLLRLWRSRFQVLRSDTSGIILTLARLSRSTSLNSGTVRPRRSSLFLRGPSVHCLLPRLLPTASSPVALLRPLPVLNPLARVPISNGNQITPVFGLKASSGWPPISFRVKIQNLPPALPDSGPCLSCHVSWHCVLQPCWPLRCSSDTPSCLKDFGSFKSLVKCCITGEAS